jgi:hypothetical protein
VYRDGSISPTTLPGVEIDLAALFDLGIASLLAGATMTEANVLNREEEARQWRIG